MFSLSLFYFDFQSILPKEFLYELLASSTPPPSPPSDLLREQRKVFWPYIRTEVILGPSSTINYNTLDG